MRMRQDYVLLEDLLGSSASPGGITLPDSCRQKNKARVIAIGPDVKNLEDGDADLKVGDEVIINPAGMVIQIDGKDRRICKAESILMVL